MRVRVPDGVVVPRAPSLAEYMTGTAWWAPEQSGLIERGETHSGRFEVTSTRRVLAP